MADNKRHHMNKKLFLLIIFTMTIISCNQNNYKKEYYSNGKLKVKLKLNSENIPNGEFYEYFETGEKLAVGKYNKGSIIDTVYIFYKNGLIKEKGTFKNNLRNNWWFFYDSIGNLKKKVQYYHLKDTIFENQIVHFNKKGKILNKNSSYFKVNIPDTIQLGENLGRIEKYNTDLLDSNLNLITVIIENHYSEKEIKKDTFSDGTLMPFFGIYAYKKGRLIVKGIIQEQTFKQTDINKDSTDLKVITINKYFEKQIYVSENKTPSNSKKKILSEFGRYKSKNP